MTTDYNTDSLLAFQRIPHDTPEARTALERVATHRLQAAELARHPFAVQSFSNIAYLLGNHMVQFFFSPTSGFGIHRFGAHDQSRYDVMLAKCADNRMIRAVESVVAMLTSTAPEPRVQPNSELPEDDDAAALAEVVLGVVWERPLNMPQLLRDAANLACTTHLVAVEIEYGETDIPVQVPRYKAQKQPNPLYEPGDADEDREIEVQVESGFETAYTSDIKRRIWSGFNISIDPLATDEHDLTWVARTTAEDKDWIVETYAKKEEGYFHASAVDLADSLVVGPITGTSLYWWNRIKDIIESPQYHGFGLAGREIAPNQVLLHVIDIKPSKAFPRGRTLIFGGESLLYAGDARAWSEQYPWRWHPYSFFGWFRMPGRFYRVPLCSQILPLQKKINSIDALVQKNREYMAFGQYWLPKSAKVQEGRISGFPGEHYVYNDTGTGLKPERVHNQPMPQELLVERQLLSSAIDYHAAVWVTPEGQISPSANRAGSMLDHLRQERLQNKKPMLQDFEHFLEGICQNILIEMQLNLVAEDPELTQRVQMAARDYSSLAIQAFTGASLRDHHTVKIDITSGLMRTQEALAAKAIDFVQFMGGQITPAERRAVLEAIGLLKFVENPENASVERAKRIISRIRTRQLDQVFGMPGEAAGAMLPILTDEILSDRFHDLDEQQKKLLMAYQQMYEQIVQQQQMQALQQQMLMAQSGAQPRG